MKGIILSLISLSILISLVACSSEPARTFPPPEGYSSWDEYYGNSSGTSNENYMSSLISDKLGSCNREGIQKVSNIKFVNAGYGYNIDIYFAINENWSDDDIKIGARIDVLDVMEALYTCGKDIQWVDMYGTYSMMDNYGNTKEMEVMHVRLGKDTARKINWSNITTDMLFNLLDFKDINPAFK